MTVDGIPVEITDEKNILEVIRKAGIKLPTFCYHSDLSVYRQTRKDSENTAKIFWNWFGRTIAETVQRAKTIPAASFRIWQ